MLAETLRWAQRTQAAMRRRRRHDFEEEVSMSWCRQIVEWEVDREGRDKIRGEYNRNDVDSSEKSF